MARVQGQWDQSHQFFEQAIERDPQNVFLLDIATRERAQVSSAEATDDATWVCAKMKLKSEIPIDMAKQQ